MRFFIKSYGCQMNSYDSLRIMDSLIEAGHKKVDSIKDANLVIFNTCSIREKADEKLFSDLGRVRLFKENSLEDFIIIVAGCLAQVGAKDILRRAPYVDMVIGPQDIQRISSKMGEVKNRDPIISATLDSKSKFLHLSDEFFNREASEFLTIQEGCDNFCTYCVVPYTRGREFSRSASDIIKEAEKLISFGVKEIILLGQNVNSYMGEGVDGKMWSLSRLLFELAELNGLKRLRYTTSHPKDIDIEIAKAHKEIDILTPFLHLPVQSGSDDILKKMNRKYSVNEYLKRLDILREYRADIAFSSDFIVGFPGETNEDFDATLKLIEKVKFAQAYSFKYSPRPNTAAAKMNKQVPESAKSDRLRILQDLLNAQQHEFNLNSVGSYRNVLFTKKGNHENQLVGRSEYSQAVSVYANYVSIGDMARVKITEAASHSLIGNIEQ